jgi:hypothetical protein
MSRLSLDAREHERVDAALLQKRCELPEVPKIYRMHIPRKDLGDRQAIESLTGRDRYVRASTLLGTFLDGYAAR